MMTKIHILDLNFQNVSQAIAVYLVEGPSSPVLVECGPGSTLPALKARLADYGYKPEDVKHVLVTHIHFDHAGSAGWWASQGAQVYVHYFGARHLIAPAKLIASATRIYGDKMDTLWGEIVSAPASNVTAVYDNDIINAGGLQFKALESPGHARHHHVYRLEDIAFTGDAAGIRIPGNPLVDLPAPPPEFEREVWQETIDRLVAEQFTAIYPTHYGRVEDAAAQFAALRTLIDEAAVFVHERMQAGMDRNNIVQQYRDWNQARAKAAGVSKSAAAQYETANPLDMSVDGIMRYWRKREE